MKRFGHTGDSGRTMIGAFLCGVMVVFASASTAPAADGIDLYLQACRRRGDNPAVIQSARVELEAHILTQAPSDADVAKRTEQVRQAIREQMERSKNDEAILVKLKSALEETDRFVKPQMVAQAFKELRARVLFRSSPETGHLQYHFWFQQLDRAKQEWSEPVQGIRENGPRGALRGTYFDTRDGAAIVSAGAFNVGIRDVRTFGRIQGAPASMTTAAFVVDAATPDLLDFSEQRIQEFRKELETFAKNKNVRPLSIVREELFENSIAHVVETSRMEAGKTIPMQRAWIDPSRDYICPVVELFREDGRLAMKWESSGYFLYEPSGLWYPARHIYIEFEDDGTTHRRLETYEIDRDRLALNHNPTAAEFAIELPEGCNIIDARAEPQKKYKTRSRLTLSLDNLSEAMSSLPSAADPAARTVAPLARNSRTILLVLINVVVLALIAGGLWYRRRTRGGAAVALLATGLLLHPGCSSPPKPVFAPASTVRVEPKHLDFGRVRESEEPVTLAFEIVNAGGVPVSVARIDAGCGCTVAVVPQPNIPPNGSVRGSAKVNLHGRVGPFSNQLSIHVSGQNEAIDVPIREEVVRDLWYDGKEIRCISDGSETSAACTFEILTADWPLVTFDASEKESGVSVREVSRSSRDKLTVIRFRAEFDVPADQNSAGSWNLMRAQ